MAKKKAQSSEEVILPQTAEEKKEALQVALNQIKKDFGAGAIMKLGENEHMNVVGISTGSLTLDMALGIGGVPRGRIVEIYGPESSGKTTVALHVVAQTQKEGGIAAFIDVEHALDPVYAKALGVNIQELLVSQPDSGEQALEITEALIRSGAIDVVVVDSVAALVTQQEIDGMMGSAQVGAQARLMSQAMRKLASVVAKTNCVAIFINQLREKVGVMYGNPEVTPGGRALKFYSSVRIDVRKEDTLKNGKDPYGIRVRCKIIKNKVSVPFKVANFDILFGKGISRSGELVEIGVLLDIIEKSGSWFSFNGERIGQGKEKVKEFLEKNPDVMDAIEAKIKENSDKLDLSMDPDSLEQAREENEDTPLAISINDGLSAAAEDLLG